MIIKTDIVRFRFNSKLRYGKIVKEGRLYVTLARRWPTTEGGDIVGFDDCKQKGDGVEVEYIVVVPDKFKPRRMEVDLFYGHYQPED